MAIVLKKGAWREFKIFLRLKGFAEYWDSNISRNIFMVLQTEEIRGRFLSAFPPLRSYEKLDLSLDDIINPIEVFEKTSHRKGCHPGRLTLNPDRYSRAWGEGRWTTLLDPNLYGQDAPPYMRAGYLASPWANKHRLLDVSEDIENPHRSALERDDLGTMLQWGLQDLYFLGGLPLLYWCNGDSMGMMVPQIPPNSNTYQWPGTVFRRRQTWQEGEDMTSECGRTYCFSRMWYIPMEVAWWEQDGEGEFLEMHNRAPMTWNGNRDWIGKGPDTSNLLFGHNVYIKYIQKIEDFDEAAKCRGEEIHGLKFDEEEPPQGITLGGYVSDLG